MKLNIKFVTNINRDAKDNEVIFVNKKTIKSKYLKPLNKSIFSSKLFNEQNFLKKDYNDKSYIFVNCTKSELSIDYEKMGSKLYEFLTKNKIEASFINSSNNSLTSVQLEKILHGAQLKSYDFNIYRTAKKNKIANNNLL